MISSPPMHRITSRLCRPTIAAMSLCVLSTLAQTLATLPAELEPYFAAIRMVESRNHPWSIFDNTTRQSYRLNSRKEAEDKAAELIKYGHNVDLGLMQLNCRYQCNRPGVGLANVFDPEVNVNTAKIIFLEFWEQARRISTDFKTRIIAAVGAYNNGRVGTPNVAYVTKVWQQMGKPVDQLPDQATSPNEQSARNIGLMDEAMARIETGTSWARERWQEITKDRKDANRTDKNPEKSESTSIATAATTFIGVLAIGALLLLAWPAIAKVLVIVTKLLGGKAGVARAGARYASNRSKKTQEQMGV